MDAVVDAVGPLFGRHALPEEHRDEDDGREHHQVHVEALADVVEVKLEERHGDEGFGDAFREAAVHHGVEEEEEVHHGHADRDALLAGEATADRAGEDGPPEVVVRQSPVAARLQQVVGVVDQVVGHRRGHDVVLVVVAVAGDPLVEDELVHDSGLDVLDGDAQHVPGAHVPQAGVVVPQPQHLQLAERDLRGQEEGVDASGGEELPGGIGEAPHPGVLVLAGEHEVDLRGGGVLRERPRLDDDLVHVHVLRVVVPQEGHRQPLDVPVVLDDRVDHADEVEAEGDDEAHVDRHVVLEARLGKVELKVDGVHLLDEAGPVLTEVVGVARGDDLGGVDDADARGLPHVRRLVEEVAAAGVDARRVVFRQERLLVQRPRVDLVHGAVLAVDETGRDRSVERHHPEEPGAGAVRHELGREELAQVLAVHLVHGPHQLDRLAGLQGRQLLVPEHEGHRGVVAVEGLVHPQLHRERRHGLVDGEVVVDDGRPHPPLQLLQLRLREHAVRLVLVEGDLSGRLVLLPHDGELDGRRERHPLDLDQVPLVVVHVHVELLRGGVQVLRRRRVRRHEDLPLLDDDAPRSGALVAWVVGPDRQHEVGVGPPGAEPEGELHHVHRVRVGVGKLVAERHVGDAVAVDVVAHALVPRLLGDDHLGPQGRADLVLLPGDRVEHHGLGDVVDEVDHGVDLPDGRVPGVGEHVLAEGGLVRVGDVGQVPLADVRVVGHVLGALKVGERDGLGIVVVEDVVDGLGDGHGGGEQVLDELVEVLGVRVLGLGVEPLEAVRHLLEHLHRLLPADHVDGRLRLGRAVLGDRGEQRRSRDELQDTEGYQN